MRQCKRTVLLTALACLAAPGAAVGQGGGLSAGFAKGPAVGQPLPNVAGYDADGNKFQLNQLKGHYTVLVFGCLT